MFDRYRKMRRSKIEGLGEEGFTLIELLIVIIIMGILAAVVVFALGGVTGSSAVAACNTDAKSVEVGVQAYVTTSGGNDPADVSTLVYSATNPTAALHTWPSNDTYYYIGLAITNTGSLGGFTVAADPVVIEFLSGSPALATYAAPTGTALAGEVWVEPTNGPGKTPALLWQNYDTFAVSAAQVTANTSLTLGANICSTV